MIAKLAELRKAAVAVVGVIGLIVSAGILHGQVAHIAETVLAIATSYGVYVVPNKSA